MAYDLLLVDIASSKTVYEKSIGTGTTIFCYWESIADRIRLPWVAEITELTDTEAGFLLRGQQVKEFQRELVRLKEYWVQDIHEKLSAPETLISDLKEIISEIEKLGDKECELIIG